jgi:hypothetical protein
MPLSLSLLLLLLLLLLIPFYFSQSYKATLLSNAYSCYCCHHRRHYYIYSYRKGAPNDMQKAHLMQQCCGSQMRGCRRELSVCVYVCWWGGIKIYIMMNTSMSNENLKRAKKSERERELKKIMRTNYALRVRDSENWRTNGTAKTYNFLSLLIVLAQNKNALTTCGERVEKKVIFK